MLFAHVSNKVSGSVILWFFLFGYPFTADAVGNAGEDTVQTQWLVVSKATSVIVP